MLKCMFGNNNIVPNNFQQLQQQMMQQQQNNNHVSAKNLFDGVITQIMPYAGKISLYDFGGEGNIEEDATFDRMSLSFDLEKLQEDKKNHKTNILSYRNNLANWLRCNHTGQVIRSSQPSASRAKKLDDKTVRVVDSAGDFVVDFSADKIIFYRVSGGNSEATENFFSKNIMGNDTQKIEYDVDKDNYAIFLTTFNCDRRLELVPHNNEEIKNITLSGHGLVVDVEANGSIKRHQFMSQGNEQESWKKFCKENNINIALHLTG